LIFLDSKRQGSGFANVDTFRLLSQTGSVRSNGAGKFGTGVRCIARAAGRAGVKKEDLWSRTSAGRHLLNAFVILTGNVLSALCKTKKKTQTQPPPQQQQNQPEKNPKRKKPNPLWG